MFYSDAIDICSLDPCNYWGICIIVDLGKYECVCPPGFTGERCLTGKYQYLHEFYKREASHG